MKAIRNNEQLKEKNIADYRSKLAKYIVLFSIIGLVLISAAVLFFAKDKGDATSQTFGTLVPLFATWVGTVLAFYFGRENFEAASNRYKEIIDIMRPEILDDIFIGRIMISLKTMVSLELADAKTQKVKELVAFLESVNKSRLPILEDGKTAYILHKSTMLEGLNNWVGNSSKSKNSTEMGFEDLLKAYPNISKAFLEAKPGETLESVRKRLKTETPNAHDVFVLDEKDKVLGWLTDSLIMRYMKS